jgi:hypothetical protein
VSESRASARSGGAGEDYRFTRFDDLNASGDMIELDKRWLHTLTWYFYSRDNSMSLELG